MNLYSLHDFTNEGGKIIQLKSSFEVHKWKVYKKEYSDSEACIKVYFSYNKFAVVQIAFYFSSASDAQIVWEINQSNLGIKGMELFLKANVNWVKKIGNSFQNPYQFSYLEIKKKFELKDTEISDIFSFKSVGSFANSSAKKRYEKALAGFYNLIFERLKKG